MIKKYLWLLVLPLLFLVSCSDSLEESCKYKPKIIDETGHLSNKTKELFLNFDYPFGVYPVLYNLDTIEDKIKTGSTADDIFKRLSKDKHQYRDFKQVGFLVLVSEDPELIQVRMGKRYDSYCNLTGITSGKEYISLQQSITDNGINKSLLSFLKLVSVRIDERNALPDIKKGRINGALSTVNNMLEYAGTPSRTFYGRVILKPLLVFISAIYRIFNSWGFAIFLLFGCAFFIRMSLEKVLLRSLSHKPLLANLLNGFLSFIFGLLFSISAAGAACILSSGRMEDMIALNALGIPFIEMLATDVSNFEVTSSRWLVSFFVLMWTLKTILIDEFYLSLLPSEVQKENYVNYQKFLGNTEIDASLVEDAPYTTYYTSYLSNVVWQMFLLAVAAFFLLPEMILRIGIAISFTAFLANMWKLRSLMSKAVPDIRSHMRGKLLLNMGVIFILSLIVLIVVPAMDPRPERRVVDYEGIKTEVIEPVILEGNYTIESSTADNSRYGSAILKKITDREYRLFVMQDERQRVFSVFYDSENMMFSSDELGFGIVHYNKILETIKVEFNINTHTKWILSK